MSVQPSNNPDKFLKHCRDKFLDTMEYEGLRKIDAIRNGIPEQSLVFFLKGGNITLKSLARYAEKIGYRVEIKMTRLPVEHELANAS